MNGPELLFWMLVGHALCDYPLQGDFLARAKNRANPLPGVPWIHGLLPHAALHAGAVALVTGSVWLGLAEFIAHCLIDDAKCTGRFGFSPSTDFHIDQGLHVLCKIAWTLIALWHAAILIR